MAKNKENTGAQHAIVPADKRQNYCPPRGVDSLTRLKPTLVRRICKKYVTWIRTTNCSDIAP